MIKTILVPIGGSNTDRVVLEAARTVASALLAHIEFLHVHIGPGEAALHTPHVGFARGAALRNALRELDETAANRAAMAERSVLEFCSRSHIELIESPRAPGAVTAQWRREEGDALQRLLFHARHNDLVVMARPTQSDGLAPDRLEKLLLQCGRPLLVVPAGPAVTALRTAMVCWKETPDAARALSAAMPLLAMVPRVVILSVTEGGDPQTRAVEELVNQLGWHGINAESLVLSRDGSSTAQVLFATAKSHAVDLMVMGGYGHAHAREAIFGGCTQAAIEAAEIPVLLAH